MTASNADVLVSVIVPTFQRQEYLVITLNSILSQTHKTIEVLVVSDGHDENTETVVNDIGDSRVQYHSTEHAGFPAVPRNVGLRQAQGELLAFCDDDDIWYPTKLADQVPMLLDGQYGMCTTDYDFIDPQGNLLRLQNYYAHYHGRITWEAFFHSMGFICNAACLFTRAIFEDVGPLNEDPKLKAHEDFEYWMRILQRSDGFFMNQKLVGYRVHPGSIQKIGPWGILQRRLQLHRILRRDLDIPSSHYSRKICKLWVHYFMDQFPPAKHAIRRIQGKRDSQ